MYMMFVKHVCDVTDIRNMKYRMYHKLTCIQKYVN